MCVSADFLRLGSPALRVGMSGCASLWCVCCGAVRPRGVGQARLGGHGRRSAAAQLAATRCGCLTRASRARPQQIDGRVARTDLHGRQVKIHHLPSDCPPPECYSETIHAANRPPRPKVRPNVIFPTASHTSPLCLRLPQSSAVYPPPSVASRKRKDAFFGDIRYRTP